MDPEPASEHVDGPESGAEKSPDKTLAQLYKSARPPVELLPGVNLSALVNTAWLPSDAKVSQFVGSD